MTTYTKEEDVTPTQEEDPQAREALREKRTPVFKGL